MTPEEMAALHAACFPDAPWDAGTLQGLLDQPSTRLLTSDHGFLIAAVVPPEAEILTICVDPAHRRRGAAALLLSRLLAQAEVVFLEVAADNAGAVAFYTAQGFRQTGRRAGYYRRPDGSRTDALTMARGPG